MKRDYAASEVTVGSVWFVWGEHREVIDRFDVRSNEVGAPPTIPMVKLCPLNSDGTRKRVKTIIPIQAWRVTYYGEPSAAFA
jgi:hypothetical protein